MSEIEALRVDSKDLSIRASRLGEDSIELAMTGSAETTDAGALTALVRRLQEHAQQTRLAEVVVDLRQLEFMNSACFKAFVTWLGELRQADGSAQYRVRFVSDRNKHWQRRSLGALQCFAPSLVSITH
jgi:hypothetical protein